MRFWPAALRLVGAYLLGMLGMGCFVTAVDGSGHWGFAIVLALLGAVLASPMLIVAILALALFRQHIEEHLAGWCCAAPFPVTAVWVGYSLGVFRGSDVFSSSTEMIKSIVGVASLGFVSAATAALVFYFLQRDRV